MPALRRAFMSFAAALKKEDVDRRVKPAMTR